MGPIRKSVTQMAGAVALALMLSAGSAAAQDDPCADGFGLPLVTDAINAAEFLSRNNADKDRDGLLRKVEMAEVKVGLEKYADAVQKLEDAEDKVIELLYAPKAKIGEGAQDILDAIDVAIGCIVSL